MEKDDGGDRTAIVTSEHGRCVDVCETLRFEARVAFFDRLFFLGGKGVEGFLLRVGKRGTSVDLLESYVSRRSNDGVCKCVDSAV